MIPLEIISPGFKLLETGYINWLSTMGYSHSTIAARKRYIKEFLLYLERSGITSIEGASNYKVGRFVRYLRRRENKLFGSGLMNASINVGVSTVNKFFQYLHESGSASFIPDNLEYLEENELIPRVRYRFSVGSAGHVIEQSPEAGEEVLPGQFIDLLVGE